MKKILFTIFTLFIFASIGIFNSNLSFAGEIYSLDNNKIEIKDYSNGIETIFSIIIDEKGYFYKEILQGEDKGSFEAWDGENFYRYSKDYNNLLVVNDPKDGSKVIAHPFLSEVINERIVDDISNNKLKKSFLSKEYKKIEKEKNEVVETVFFDKENSYLQKYDMHVDNKKIYSYEITDIKKLENDLDIQKYINLLESSVIITRIESNK